MKQGKFDSARKMLQSIKREAPEYLTEVTKLEVLIRTHDEHMLRNQYERFRQACKVSMRNKNYRDAIHASEQALKIAQDNPRLGLDISNIKSMHMMATQYETYDGKLKKFEKLMHAKKGNRAVSIYVNALKEAKSILAFVDYFDTLEDMESQNPRFDVDIQQVENKVAFVRRGVHKGGDYFFKVDNPNRASSKEYEIEIFLYKEFESIL